MPAKAGIQNCVDRVNEVQHLLEEVLPWDGATASFHWTTAARLPAFKKPGNRSGKSRQLWIARHRRFSGAEAQPRPQVGYKPAYAQEQTKARRWKGSRLEREPEPARTVLERLGQRLVARAGRRPARPRARPQRHQLRDHLPLHLRPDRPHQGLSLAPLSAARQVQARLSRPQRRQLGSFIEDRVSIAERPPEAGRSNSRGHWEADLMLFAKIRPGHPDRARTPVPPAAAIRPPARPPSSSPSHLVEPAQRAAANLRQTITFDNGTEFARHHLLHRLGIETFFCDPYAPGKKAASKTPSAACAASCRAKPTSPPCQTSRFIALVAAYNNTPRKCLDFRTPAEIFSQLLH